MRAEITKITIDTMMGIREGVGTARVSEFIEYIQNLVEAKEAGLDVSVLPWPMLMDRVKQGVDAGLSTAAKAGVEGGIEWKFINLGGSYDSETQQGIRVKVDMEFMSVGAPDFQRLKELSVPELKALMEVVEKEAVAVE